MATSRHTPVARAASRPRRRSVGCCRVHSGGGSRPTRTLRPGCPPVGRSPRTLHGQTTSAGRTRHTGWVGDRPPPRPVRPRRSPAVLRRQRRRRSPDVPGLTENGAPSPCPAPPPRPPGPPSVDPDHKRLDRCPVARGRDLQEDLGRLDGLEEQSGADRPARRLARPGRLGPTTEQTTVDRRGRRGKKMGGDGLKLPGPPTRTHVGEDPLSSNRQQPWVRWCG
jgi:hypothetical protein